MLFSFAAGSTGFCYELLVSLHWHHKEGRNLPCQIFIPHVFKIVLYWCLGLIRHNIGITLKHSKLIFLFLCHVKCHHLYLSATFKQCFTGYTPHSYMRFDWSVILMFKAVLHNFCKCSNIVILDLNWQNYLGKKYICLCRLFTSSICPPFFISRAVWWYFKNKWDFIIKMTDNYSV